MLPAVTSFELSLGLLDYHLVTRSTTGTTTEAMGLSSYVRFLDHEVAFVHSRLVLLSRVASSAVSFARDLDSALQVDRPLSFIWMMH